MAAYTTQRYCDCSVSHRSHTTMAKCIWKRAAWVSGAGPYALLAHCQVLTVTLHRTAEAAERSKEGIDGACGHMCSSRHEIVELVLA